MCMFLCITCVRFPCSIVSFCVKHFQITFNSKQRSTSGTKPSIRIYSNYLETEKKRMVFCFRSAGKMKWDAIIVYAPIGIILSATCWDSSSYKQSKWRHTAIRIAVTHSMVSSSLSAALCMQNPYYWDGETMAVVYSISVACRWLFMLFVSKRWKWQLGTIYILFCRRNSILFSAMNSRIEYWAVDVDDWMWRWSLGTFEWKNGLCEKA